MLGLAEGKPLSSQKTIGKPDRLLELQPFFARGALLLVDGRQDLIAVAEALAQNEQHKVAAWLAEGVLSKAQDTHAKDLLTRNPALWAVVVAPWVLAQERR